MISKWATEGMHRSLAKQDTLAAQMSFPISFCERNAYVLHIRKKSIPNSLKILPTIETDGSSPSPSETLRIF